MLDPRGIYDVDEAAVARTLGSRPGAGPVLLHSLTGFVDAGAAGQQAVQHLLDRSQATRLVTFDVDQLLDYRSKRASMTFESDHWSDYDEPHLAIDHLLDAEGTGFLLLHGSEPDVQWERVIAALTGLIERFDVTLTVGFHGIPMGVPHTRPTSATPQATRPELLGEHTTWFGTVKVPASLSSLLQLRLGEAGHDAVAYAVNVPHYLAQSTYPPAAVVALEQVQHLTGLDLVPSDLAEAASEATAEVERQVHESEEVTAIVRALEEQYDAFARQANRGNLLADSQIPTADEIGAEFERFLAQQSGD